MPLSPCFADLDEELAATRRMLERFPDGRGSWRPHEKSRTLGELATHVAGIPRTGLSVITTDSFDIAARKPAPALDSAAELLAAFDAAATDVRKAAHAATEADLDGTWALRAGNHVIVSGTKRDLVRRMMLSHMIHHRAQIGVYYRLLDVKVPGMYGPTADD
jgi:uncharacterized damage-inducible protein DinB